MVGAEDAEAALLVNAQSKFTSGPEGNDEAVHKILAAKTDKSPSPETVKLSEVP